jgi:WD40 repeat protein
VCVCVCVVAAKRGGNDGPKILALASESGTIKLIDTRSASTSASSHSGSGSAFASASTSSAVNTTMQFYPHQNAIFDLAWDQADERLLTASGDQLGAVHRLGQAGEVRREAVLVGHTSSVKTCTWYDDSEYSIPRVGL